ncbi:hypothetical protein EI94DRAFT_1818491 [Lactarius quietus]|nr:hypothetical protein EI94DRAFT_1818491 [Lactarius quietus]
MTLRRRLTQIRLDEFPPLHVRLQQAIRKHPHGAPRSGRRARDAQWPKALNALDSASVDELNEALRLIDADKEIGAIVITGSEEAFAGACALATSFSPCNANERTKQPARILRR